jgi:hypothetical protein
MDDFNLLFDKQRRKRRERSLLHSFVAQPKARRELELARLSAITRLSPRNAPGSDEVTGTMAADAAARRRGISSAGGSDSEQAESQPHRLTHQSASTRHAPQHPQRAPAATIMLATRTADRRFTHRR